MAKYLYAYADVSETFSAGVDISQDLRDNLSARLHNVQDREEPCISSVHIISSNEFTVSFNGTDTVEAVLKDSAYVVDYDGYVDRVVFDEDTTVSELKFGYYIGNAKRYEVSVSSEPAGASLELRGIGGEELVPDANGKYHVVNGKYTLVAETTEDYVGNEKEFYVFGSDMSETIPIGEIAVRTITFSLNPSDAVLVVKDKDSNVVEPVEVGGLVYELLDSSVAGLYTYEATKDGYTTAVGTVDAQQDATVSITLTVAYTITFDVTPSDSDVVVEDADGNIVEPTTAGGKVYSLEASATAGSYTYTVSKEQYISETGIINVQADDTITVTIKQLSSIAVTTAPAKTSYDAGDVFDPTGMVVTATFSDGSTSVVIDYTYAPTGALTELDTTITITYSVAGVTKTTTQTISFEQSNHLKFTAIENTDIAFTKTGTFTNEPVIYYSMDDSTWTQYTYGTTITLSAGGSTYWKGDNDSFNESTSNYIKFTSTGNVSASGDVMSLLDSDVELLTVTSYSFCYLFKGCNKLITAPSLQATTLASSCYREMFQDCTSLATAPELPATTLAQYCYRNMFYGCTSLTTAPELPATTLESYCYDRMFNGCTSLTVAPALPATTLKDSCYAGMFSGCTSLTTAPSLLATSCASYGYAEMFNGCTSLTTPPQINVPSSITNYLFSGMFRGCTSLTTAPSLPASKISEGGCQDMFNGCTSLVTAPELPATTVGRRSYYRMFYGCTNLTTAPTSIPATSFNSAEICYSMFEGCEKITTAPTLHATSLGQSCCQSMFKGCTRLTTAYVPPATSINASEAYRYMFQDCTSLATAPALPATTINNSCYTGMFRGCTSLTTAPVLSAIVFNGSAQYSEMFYGCTNLTTAPALPATTLTSSCYANMFRECTSLTAAPSLPATTLQNSCYNGMFQGCTSLVTAPELSATTMTSSCYSYMFKGCTSLVTPPALPATTLNTSCYSGMFSGCTSLTAAPSLQATTLASSCYREMFQDCTSLATAPELSATTMVDSCYSYMFAGCTSLVTPPALPATTLNTSCYSNMFYGCTSLKTLVELPATTLSKTCYSSMFRYCSKIKISRTQTDEYQYVFRIPSNGNVVSSGLNWNNYMISGTGGTMTADPSHSTDYYTNIPPVPASQSV